MCFWLFRPLIAWYQQMTVLRDDRNLQLMIAIVKLRMIHIGRAVLIFDSALRK
jgi:hypothetical protein